MQLQLTPEHMVRQVLDHALFMVATDGRVQSWNAGVRAILGWDEADWLQQSFAAVFTDEDRTTGVPEHELAQAAAAGRADDDRWMQRRNGERFFCAGSLTAIRDDGGAVVAFLKIIRDNTLGHGTAEDNVRLLQSERALHAATERQAAVLRATIDAIPDAVFIGNADGITSCNQRALDQLGASSIADLQARIDELGQRFRVRLERHGPPLAAERLPFNRALAGETSVLETWVSRPGGGDLLIRGTAAPIHVHGDIVGAVAVNSDLTERVRLEDQRFELARVASQLSQSEEAFRAIVNGVRDYAIFTVDPKGNISSWHVGAQLMKGYSEEEAIGMPFENLFTPEDRARGQPQREMDTAARSGEYKGAGHRLRKGGQTFDAEVVLTALRGADGRLLGYVKLTQDITQRKRLEAEGTETLRQALEARFEAERASHAMGELLATISHELRTPLSAILGWAQLLQRGLPDAAIVQQAIAAITRNASAQVKLVGDLLDVSRIESGQMRLELQPVDVASVVAGAIDAVMPSADLKRIAIQTVLTARAGSVLGDAERLQQVVGNLLSNAVKFTPVDGSVTVTVRRQQRTVEIAVADTGQGMTPDFLPHAFSRFQQQDGSRTRRHGGLGIGLAIVHQLVQLHGGTVRAESPGQDRGSVFTVVLPVAGAGATARAAAADGNTGAGAGAATAEAPLAEIDADAEADAPPVGTNQRLNKLRLLLVDDDPDGRAVGAYALRAAGADVVEAGSAEEGLARFREQRPAAILSDIGMPRHDGYELITWVRDIDRAEGRLTPAAAFTAYARPDDRKRALDAGFQLHLVKPLSPQALVEAVVGLLQASMGDTADSRQAGVQNH